MKTKLTQKQKALRYEYIEKAILKFLDEKIDSVRSNESEEEYTPVANIVEEWIDDIDRNDNIIPKQLFLLFDRICDENFFTYDSYKNVSYFNKQFDEMNKQIGD